MCLYSWDYKINYNENEDKNENKITDTTKIRCLYKKACSTERFKFRLNNYKSAHLTFTKKKSVKQLSLHADFEDGGHYVRSDWDISFIDETKTRSLK